MKSLFTLLLSLVCAICFAQNYECFKGTQYFLNVKNYLRGIRINSVQQTTDATIYYPYRTMRGGYIEGLGRMFNHPDSLVGSWLGEQVVAQKNGTWLFDNMWGDTVIINTQAQIGDSWHFFDGPFNLYFTARVTAIDTMTIAGSMDSVKKILLTAHNRTSGVVEDADNAIIILSKHHGFVQVIDLYTFPYHKPDSAYKHGTDFFVDEVGRDITFQQIDFQIPGIKDVYSWNVGDVFQYKEYTFSERYYLDTIISATQTISADNYITSGWIASLYWEPNANGRFRREPYTSTRSFSTAALFGMPEEGKNPIYCYYYPADTSECSIAPLYRVNGVTGYAGSDTYKTGIGLVSYIHPHGNGYDDFSMLYTNKSGKACGKLSSVKVPIVATIQANIDIYPNPANATLSVNFSNQGIYKVSLINMLGRVVYSATAHQQQNQVNTSNLPAGIYNVHITDEQNNSASQRIVIIH